MMMGTELRAAEGVEGPRGSAASWFVVRRSPS